MVRGYRRFSAADEDEIWARLRAGYAAKPTARALGLYGRWGAYTTWSGVAGSGPRPAASVTGPVQLG